MDETSEILHNNRIEDITWFCSLSDSELDFLISLKKLAIQRTKISGHEELAEKFALKMFRALGLVLMEYAPNRVQDDTSLIDAHQIRLLDNCNLLRPHVKYTIDIEEILTEIRNKNSGRKLQKSKRRKAGCSNTSGCIRDTFLGKEDTHTEISQHTH